MNRERFRFFRVAHFESDLLVGVPSGQFDNRLHAAALDELVRLRGILQDYMRLEPGFAASLDPLPAAAAPDGEKGGRIPEEISCMLECGIKSGTGPMSSVAGLFAEYVGKRLRGAYPLGEVVVENGGDLYLDICSDAHSMIHAGGSALSDKLAFVIPPGSWGVCTSSGTMGHSYSRGRADAVTIIARSAPLADAWATSLANRISVAGDIETVLQLAAGIPDIRGIAAIVDDQVGIRGDFELKLLS